MSKENEEKQFFFYIIPAELAEEGSLTKAMVYGVISSLANKKGYCSASNKFIAQKLKRKNISVISNYVSELEKEGWIKTKIYQTKGNHRRIYLFGKIKKPLMKNHKTSYEKSKNPSYEKSKQSNINNSNINSNKKSKVCNYSPKAMELAKSLYDLIKKENPDWHVKPNWDKWAEDIDKINRLDGRTWEQIDWMIRWTQQHEFWHKNILSPNKLRQQFNRLVVQAKSEVKNKSKGKGILW